jgi:hypothetical protein
MDSVCALPARLESISDTKADKEIGSVVVEANSAVDVQLHVQFRQAKSVSNSIENW